MGRPRQGAPPSAVGTLPHTGAGWPGWIDLSASERLQEAIRGGRIGHAYLISGPSGVGKAALASTFAKAIHCERDNQSQADHPCGVCRACRNVNRGAHPDVEVFGLDSQAILATKPLRGANLSIDTVRRLRGSAALLPLEGARRILIVEDAETLLEPAQQALLKTLEEPPSAVTIVLLADEPDALLSTVRSRCQEIAVKPVPATVVHRALLERGVGNELASELATLSRGCAAWALAAASDPALLQARRSAWGAATTWIASTPYERLVTAFRLGAQFTKRRREVIGIVQAAIHVLREEMIRAASGPERSPAEVVRSCFGAPTPSLEISQAVTASMQCLRDLETNVRPRLALEAMVLAWPNSVSQPI